MKWYAGAGVAAATLVLAACTDGVAPDQTTVRLPSTPSFIVAGAGFTTTNSAVDPQAPLTGPLCLNGPGVVNCNLYGAKQFVWTNGGPTNGANSLSDGTYFFAVLAPSGQADPNDGTAENLSDDFDAYTNRSFTVSGGKISANLGSHDQYLTLAGPLALRLFPYADTPNPGGVYIMAMCKYDPTTPGVAGGYPVTPSDCKYDAFKVKVGDNECENPDENGHCTTDPFGEVSGKKYYDANRNGQLDPTEVGIAGWKIDWTDGTSGTEITDAAGNFSRSFTADDYTFTERTANAPWVQTGNTVNQSLATGLATSTLASFVYSVHVLDGTAVTGIYFGNVCEVNNTNGFTLGFWSNNNGANILRVNDPAWRTLLNNANLWDGRKPAKAFEISTALAFIVQDKKGQPTGGAYKQFQDWILAADASKTSDMAYMLSAQMAATMLNIAYGGTGGGKLDGNALVLDPFGVWKTINAVIVDANALLGNLPGTPVDRVLAEKYKNIFDRLNNNLQTVTPPTQGGCPTPVFP